MCCVLCTLNLRQLCFGQNTSIQSCFKKKSLLFWLLRWYFWYYACNSVGRRVTQICNLRMVCRPVSRLRMLSCAIRNEQH